MLIFILTIFIIFSGCVEENNVTKSNESAYQGPVNITQGNISSTTLSSEEENIPEIEIMENITSWLFTIARNRITDKYRKKKPDIFSDIEIIKSDDDDSLNLSDIIANTGDLPDKELIIKELWKEVEEALDELPDEQKEVFVLTEFEGYSYKEISSMLDVPVNTLLSRNRYSVLYLRKKLQKLYKEIKNVS